jgi:squalene-associated FAD-dependent desaturase
VAQRALVIGAGWAGLAAAVGLCEGGADVTLVEAAAEPGGRARALALDWDGQPVSVDNGQHLLIGAYRSTLALLARVGVPADTVLERRPMRLSDPLGLDWRAWPLPAPWHLAAGLLAARGLSAGERWALATAMHGLRHGGPSTVAEGTTVAAWLAARHQPAALVRRIWEPLAVGALNTPIERACARTFARVLCDALLVERSGADFLLPRGTLGDVLPAPAARWLAARGAGLRTRTACRALQRLPDGRWRAVTDAGALDADRVVLAVPPLQAARLLESVAAPERLRPLRAFEHETIATVWLGWREPVDLPPVTMLNAGDRADAWGQWLFARPAAAGPAVSAVAGVVVSAAGRTGASIEVLADAVARQVARQLRRPVPTHRRAVVEKRATIRCSPDRPRVGAGLLADVAPGLALAGDWAWPDYPATLEAAVRSGDAASAWLRAGPAGAGPRASA